MYENIEEYIYNLFEDYDLPEEKAKEWSLVILKFAETANLIERNEKYRLMDIYDLA